MIAYEEGMLVGPEDILAKYIESVVCPVLVGSPDGKYFIKGEPMEMTMVAIIGPNFNFEAFWGIGTHTTYDPDYFVRCTSEWVVRGAWNTLMEQGYEWEGYSDSN